MKAPKRPPKNHLSKIILQHTGLGIRQFCNIHLNCSYETFYARYKSGNIHLTDYVMISEISGISLHDLVYQDPEAQEMIERLRKEAALFKEQASLGSDQSESLDDAEEPPSDPEPFKFIDV